MKTESIRSGSTRKKPPADPALWVVTSGCFQTWWAWRIYDKNGISEVKNLVKAYAATRAKLWSFEVKKKPSLGTVRESLFQAVSNSSWANYGYLVAAEIDKKADKELRILCSLHGIGLIKLNVLSSTVSICKQLFLLYRMVNLNTTTPPFLHRLTQGIPLFQ